MKLRESMTNSLLFSDASTSLRIQFGPICTSLRIQYALLFVNVSYQFQPEPFRILWNTTLKWRERKINGSVLFLQITVSHWKAKRKAWRFVMHSLRVHGTRFCQCTVKIITHERWYMSWQVSNRMVHFNWTHIRFKCSNVENICI